MVQSAYGSKFCCCPEIDNYLSVLQAVLHIIPVQLTQFTVDCAGTSEPASMPIWDSPQTPM